jgi:hypothetical protein
MLLNTRKQQITAHWVAANTDVLNDVHEKLYNTDVLESSSMCLYDSPINFREKIEFTVITDPFRIITTN